MPVITLVLLFSICLDLWAQKLSPPQTLSGKVTRVTDGDTLELTQDKKRYRIRLAYIDAPEIKQIYGKSARNQLSQLVLNKSVTAHCSEIDRHKRYICHIFVGNLEVNLDLIRQGLAWAQNPSPKKPQYLQAQNMAQSEKIGIWSKSKPVAPWDWRKEQAAKKRVELAKRPPKKVAPKTKTPRKILKLSFDEP